jgi:chemotaxis protein CheD
MNQPERLETISVPIGRWGVASAPVAIRTLLGSCVGVVLYDKVARLGGVAHVVLPDSRGATDQIGRFADTAIPALISEMGRVLGRHLHGRLTAKLAGGASMFQAGTVMNIGQMNCDAVERILGELGVKIEARDVGGTAGRHLTLDTRSGIVNIRVPGGADYSI